MLRMGREDVSNSGISLKLVSIVKVYVLNAYANGVEYVEQGNYPFCTQEEKGICRK